MSKRLLFVVNVDWFFMSHRLPIALEALKQGYAVHIASGITDQKEAMERHGLIVHPISIDRSSASLFGMLRTFWQILSLYRKVKPDLVHLVTIKPVLLGGIAARLTGIHGVVAAVSGLGYVFLDHSWFGRLRRMIVAGMYRLALGHRNLKVIFQNPDDRDSLIQLTGLSPGKVEMIRGSGVDLDEFRYTPLPEGTPVVLMASRLLADKGVREFVAAARLLHMKNIKARFCLAGEIDPANPSSIAGTEIAAWVAEGIVECWGHRGDMANALSSAHVVVLPSYREGLPRVLLEAEAVGRAVVTTDVPGCRDAIKPDETGVLVRVRDYAALADAIEKILANPQTLRDMGRAGRTLAESEFDVKQVVARHLHIYRQLNASRW